MFDVGIPIKMEVTFADSIEEEDPFLLWNGLDTAQIFADVENEEQNDSAMMEEDTDAEFAPNSTPIFRKPYGEFPILPGLREDCVTENGDFLNDDFNDSASEKSTIIMDGWDKSSMDSLVSSNDTDGDQAEIPEESSHSFPFNLSSQEELTESDYYFQCSYCNFQTYGVQECLLHAKVHSKEYNALYEYSSSL